MIKYENECCDCAVPGYPCLEDDCPYTNVPHFYCDKCGEEEKIYHYGEDQLCITCIIKDLKEVTTGDE